MLIPSQYSSFSSMIKIMCGCDVDHSGTQASVLLEFQLMHWLETERNIPIRTLNTDDISG